MPFGPARNLRLSRLTQPSGDSSPDEFQREKIGPGNPQVAECLRCLAGEVVRGGLTRFGKPDAQVRQAGAGPNRFPLRPPPAIGPDAPIAPVPSSAFSRYSSRRLEASAVFLLS